MRLEQSVVFLPGEICGCVLHTYLVPDLAAVPSQELLSVLHETDTSPLSVEKILASAALFQGGTHLLRGTLLLITCQ